MMIDSSKFEEVYNSVRSKELRLYSDDDVRNLPSIHKDHIYFKEWLIRKSSWKKLEKYLKKMNRSFYALDVGCGNGWMTNALTEINNSRVIGIDPHMVEIEQARRVFGSNPRAKFVFGQLFEHDFSDERFDIIVIAASAAYFENLHQLINYLLSLMSSRGELHLIDNPIYNSKNVIKSRSRSEEYFNELGIPEMINYYHHHTWDELNSFKYTSNSVSFLKKLAGKLSNNPQSPFPWIIIKKS